MDLLEYAIGYQKLGWSVIPIVPPVVGAKDYDKKPHVKWKEFMKRIPTEKEIMKWWKQWPKANVGIVTGEVSDLVSTDIDSMQGKILYQEQIGDLPATISQRTGGGPDREQYLFHYPKGENIGNFVDIFGNKTGVDIRGNKGYIVTPPSIHKTGRLYEWVIDPLEMGLDDLCEFPRELLTFLNVLSGKTGERKNQKDWQNELLMGVDDGFRHEALMKLIGWWMYEHQNKDKVLMVAEGWNQRNRPPLPKQEIVIAVENIAKKEGLNELRTRTNVWFEEIAYYHSIDGESTWVVIVDGKTYEMKAEDFRSNNKFSTKIMNMTGKYLRPIAPKVWHPMMEKLFEECRREETQFEYTVYGPVSEIIEGLIENASPTLSYIERSAVKTNDELYIKMKVLLRKFDKQEKITRRIVKQALEKLGFVYDHKLRDEKNHQHKTWHISLDELKHNLETLI